MGLFRKKADPLSDRSKALNAQIASLEAEIKKLDHKLQRSASQPRLRSTALPHGQASSPGKTPPPPTREPVFERLDHGPFEPAGDAEDSPDHYNDLGVRKYDLTAAWRRLRNQFREPAARNPKLVSYLAAGSIKGLRPLRYEKRVARNRFIAVFLLLVCLLWGIITVFRSQ